MMDIVKFVVAFGLGLFVWHRQLIAKRRFEVAEHAMTVYDRAAEALKRIRRSFVDQSELYEVLAAVDQMPEPRRDRLPQWRVFTARTDKLSEAFDAIRPAQLLCELHVSSDASQALGELLTLRDRVLTAAKLLATDLIPASDLAKRELMRDECKRDLWEMRDHLGKPVPTDKISAILDEARRKLQGECIPLLRKQTLVEFVLGQGRK